MVHSPKSRVGGLLNFVFKQAAPRQCYSTDRVITTRVDKATFSASGYEAGNKLSKLRVSKSHVPQ